MTNSTHNVFVLADGTIRFVYDDALLPLLNAGHRRDVKRAGTIESELTAEPPPPGVTDTRWRTEWQWRVTVGGDSLLMRTREEALNVERTIVEANIAVI